MSTNDFDDLPTNNNKRRFYQYYQQLGAPTLVYEGNRRDDSHFRVASTSLTTDNIRDVYETLKSRNRVKARWQYSLDVGQIKSVVVPDFACRKRKHRAAKATKHKNTKKDSNKDEDEVEVDDNGGNDDEDRSSLSENRIDDNNEEIQEIGNKKWLDQKQQQNRLAMLLEDDTRMARHRECLENYASYEHPYVNAELKPRDRKSSHIRRRGVTKEFKIDPATYSKGQEYSINHKINSDPSYLAPFDLDSINEATNDRGSTNFRKKIQFEPQERLPQGNALLSVPCPCYPCSKGIRGYVLLHPKGHCLERLCVSNVIPPLGQNNAGDTKNENLKKIRKRTQFHWNAIASNPNEICLDDTILEIRQCGTWNVDNQQCIFTVRTGTHISVVNIMCKRPDVGAQQQYSFPSSTCWGCYVLEEIERLDHRSFSPKLPSFRPVSLASHPRYGNALTPCKFAFVNHSVGGSASSSYNVLHSCTGGAEGIITKRHDINNLRSISFIDFSNRNPMCLWSAASSYVRPALAPGAISKMQRQAKSPFGLGSSLFAIDLRNNSATFQWSPSAEEMTTEGVHSISGILTDWTRDNIVWVTSTSAGKTWEIDGRMPCRAVNTWSLTALCEASRNITISPKAFHGEPTLFTKPLTQCSDVCNETCNLNNDPDPPLIKVDTDFRANGIHIFQKPLQKPRFQTDSLECIGTPGLNVTGTASIATSSYFDLTDVSDDTFICGISSIKLPLSRFVRANDNIWPQYLEQKLNVLCTLTMNNNGDIHSHSLLECNDKVLFPDNCRRFDGLPVGTSAINIPKELDGRTKFLTNGHWKPTGGMNLNLFLSNIYPVPRNAMLSRGHNGDDSGVDQNNKILLNHPKKKKIDESTEVIEIRKRIRKPGLMISSEENNGNSNEMLKQDGDDRALIMPLSLSKNMQRNTMVYAGRGDGYDSDDTDNITEIGRDEAEIKRSLERTDLSKDVIQNTLEGWGDAPSEPESSEEYDYAHF